MRPTLSGSLVPRFRVAELGPGVEVAIRVAGRLPHAHTGVAQELEGWEKLIFREVYAAEPASIIVVILPRGHVKTTNAAKLVVLDLLQTDVANAFMAATGITQAEEMYRHAAHYAKGVGKDAKGRSRIKATDSTHRLARPDGGFARVLAADLSGQKTGKAQGFAPTIVALDEFQAWRQMAMFIDLQTALFKRGGKMLITGLPADRGHPLRALRDTALGGRVETGLRALPDGSTEWHPDGRITIARADMLVWIESGLGPDEDWRDPEVCALANLASWRTPRALARDLVVPGVPDWALQTMFACMWVDMGALDWLPRDVVDGLAIGTPVVLDTFPFTLYSSALKDSLDANRRLADVLAALPATEEEGSSRVPDEWEPWADEEEDLLVAVDSHLLATRQERDAHELMRAASTLWAQALATRGRIAVVAVDMGRYRDTSAVDVITETGGVPTWHAGMLEPAPGEPTPYAAVDVLVRALHAAGAEQIGVDPKFLDQTVDQWERDGLPAQQIPQSQDRQIAQSRALRDALVSGALRSDGNPVIHDQAMNVKVQQLGAHGWKITRGRGPVDVIIGGTMAWDLYQREPEPDEVEPWIG